MTYEIEKGIPLPDKKPRGTYPFRQMAIHDSVFIPGKEPKQAPTMLRYVRKDGMDFVYERAEKNGESGLRFWRTK